MPLTLKEVQHIANLARIELSPGDLEHYQTQLSAILDHFERLQTIDTEDVPAATSSAHTNAGLRTDQPLAGLDLAALMQNAAETDENQFRVPPVFD